MASQSQSELSAGMVQILTPVVEQCDMQLCAVLEAQKALAKQIEFFSAELLNSERVKEGEQPDAMLGSYAAKLAASRKKLKKVEMLAMQTRNRVENIERMHEQLLLSEKAFKDRVEGQVEEAPAESAGDETAKDSDEKTKVETTSSDAEDVKEATPQGPPVQQDAAEASAEAASPQAVGDGGGEDEAQTQAAGEGGTEGENKKNKKKKK